jgi:LysM repeat protein
LIGPVAKTGTDRVGQDPSRSDLPKPAPADKAADKANGQAGNGQGDGDKASATPAPATKRGSYVVQSGDSFDSIARTKLGSASLRAELQRLNPKVVPSKMQVGQELVLPSPAELALVTAPVAVGKDKVAKEAAVKLDGGSKPIVEAAADRAYTIGKGDTFERIARAELGSSKRVEELRELNPTVDPTRLRIGQRIKLPKK